MAGSMAHQRFLIQKETTPGTAAVNAMRAYRAFRGTPAYNDEGESYRARGSRGTSARTPLMESSTVSIEAPQCFNALLPVLASVLGAPVTTQPDVDDAPDGYQHVFTLLGSGERSPVTHTVQFGDSANALQIAYAIFNSLSMGVQRGALSFGTSMIGREPDHTITLANSGIVDVPAIPIPARGYDVFLDDEFADVGTTKMLRCYDLNLEVGDTWGMDTPINSAIASFSDLTENEEIDFTGNAQFAFDATAKGLIGTFKNGALKHARIASTGPTIGGTVDHLIMIDFPFIIVGRGEPTTAPGSSRVVLPFNYELTPDPVSNKLIEVTLVNKLATV